MMPVVYCSRRQLGPYRGLAHVVDMGGAIAYTTDGEHWITRFRKAPGTFWPDGNWIDAVGLEHSSDGVALRRALDARPPLPFPRRDAYELWLLRRSTGLPLALLATRRTEPVQALARDILWRSFPFDERSFRARCLEAGDANRPAGAWKVLHRDVLDRQVNGAAEPLASAQWFRREADGGGVGLGGLRLGPDATGRRLPPAAFPELLVDEAWERPVERALVAEYHDWLAARLLTHEELAPATRKRLERAASDRPAALLETFRLIPGFVDRAALEVKLVEARITAAAS